MTVERLTQKIKLGDKYLIQDSMRKLINMIAENRRNQEEIIKFLPENEIIKIMSYMEDPDPTFRKLTAKFLLELVYSNYIVQQIFCNILGILPWDGKVCINLIPESFRRSNKALPDCLEILKRNFPEEMKESLPFCWYFAPEDADESESPVKFLTQIDKKELEGADVFVDPLYAMVGFIVRTPKVKRSSGKSPECAERPLTASIELDPKKSLISNNSKVLKSVNSTTSTLNQTVQARSRKNSAIIDKGNFKSVSPSRNLASNIVVVSSTIGYPKKSAKARTETAGSSSICNSERMMQNKIGIVTEISDESNRESVNLGAHYLPGFKKYIDLKEKVPRNRESTLSNETYDVHNVKMGTSHNESNDHGSKLLETSVSNSLSMKGSFAVGLNERNSNLSSYKSANEKKVELVKKPAEKPITIEKTTERAKLKPKPMIEVDQKPDPKAASFKGLRDNGGLSLSYSAATTPKNNLLGKFLKEKPAVKENLYSSKQQIKTKVDNTKKLNSTATSLTGKHVPQKSSIGGGQKTKLLNKTETEYINKKYGLNPSLMKSIDLNDRSHGITLGEDSVKENIYRDLADRPQSCKNNTAKTKIYNISSVLKSTISTPRTPTENLKAAFGLNSKILNARKSQDVIYQTSIPRDKRRSEALVSFQNIKTKQFDIQDNVVRDSITEISPNLSRSITPKIYMQ